MKKFIIAVISFLVVGCANPSMERGLEGLEAALAELEASFLAIDVDQMSADLISMNEQVAQMIIEQEEAQEAINSAVAQVQQILASLAEIKVKLEGALTKAQVAALAASFAEIREKVELLVALADYDYDGVINAIDQCPDTPITEINNVDATGCTITGS